MNAGRELDALVAEKVMGNVVATRPRHEHAHPDDVVYFELPAPDSGIVVTDPLELPHYSTDIAAGWQVVERLGNARLWLQVDGWVAEFEDDFGLGIGAARAGAAPLAICLAALKAVGVELPE